MCPICKCPKPAVFNGFECVKGCSITLCSRACWDKHTSLSCPFKTLVRPGVFVLGPVAIHEFHWSIIAAGGVPEDCVFPLASSSAGPLMLFSPPVSSWTGWLGKRQVRSDRRPLGFADESAKFLKQTVQGDNKLGHQMADAASAQLQAGRHFLFLHPAISYIWWLHDFTKLQSRTGVVRSAFNVSYVDGKTAWHVLHNIPGLAFFYRKPSFPLFPNFRGCYLPLFSSFFH
jgi:hypothetical protein